MWELLVWVGLVAGMVFNIGLAWLALALSV
jgi:hypothetical protein